MEAALSHFPGSDVLLTVVPCVCAHRRHSVVAMTHDAVTQSRRWSSADGEKHVAVLDSSN